MNRNKLLTIVIFLIAIASVQSANAQSRSQDLQVTIPVRFITIQSDFFEKIGVDFDFATTTERFQTNSGFGAGIGGGILFPDAIGNADVSIEGKLFGNRFSADRITAQNGNTFATEGSVFDMGIGFNLAVLIKLIDNLQDRVVQTPRLVDLKLSAGGGIVNRKLDIDINDVPLVNDSGTALYGEIGAGLQFPLNLPQLPGQTAFYIGVNHRVTGGLDLRDIASIPFRFGSTSTTSVRAELIIFIKPRIIATTEQED